MRRSIIIIPILFLLLLPAATWGSLGVSPAKIENHHLLPGSTLETVLLLSRDVSSASAGLTYEIYGENLSEWVLLNTDQPLRFESDKKTTLLPLKISIPKHTPHGNYKGTVLVHLSDKKNPPLASATTQLGIQIPIHVTVTDQPYRKLLLKGIQLNSAWAPQKFIGIKEPGEIIFSATIVNEGNQIQAPKQAILHVYDQETNQLLYTAETKNIEQIPPFTEKTVTLRFISHLRPGTYTSYISILGGHTSISDKPHKVEFTVKNSPQRSVFEHVTIIITHYRSHITMIFFLLSSLLLLLFSLRVFKKRKEENFISCSIKDRPKK